MTVDLIQRAYDKMQEEHGSELKTKDVLVHSDQGSQYISTTFKKLLSNDDILQSVSSRANSQDNAPAESFFGLLKSNLLDKLKLCRTAEDAIKLVYGYISQYNNERFQYDLAGLTPHEFYLYKVTGIYPCDNYYGTEADSLRSLEELVDHRLEVIEKLNRSNRQKYSLRSRASQLLRKNPIQFTEADIELLKSKINHNTRHIEKVQKETDELRVTLNQAIQAKAWLQTLPDDKLQYFRTPQRWQTEPHLQYIYGMGGLF
jgi:hypothetical protein